jgi:predicted nuclease of restriction endonuclease-like (RecB) superfamily
MVNRTTKAKQETGATTVDTVLRSGIRDLILGARRNVVRGVNAALVWTNFEIGRRIVEHEQRGKVRAEYAEKTIRQLAQRLTEEFGEGYSYRNLNLIRRFYLIYRTENRIVQTVSAQFQHVEKSETRLWKSLTAFPLSWSHYVFLIGIDNENERRFYEIESANQNWSLRELQRQFNSSLYERLALSRDKKKVRDLAKRGQIVEKPEDLMKDPYVLEFLGLKEESAYSETDLETSVINRIEHFLLELGKGFLFEARQKRFAFEDRHFRVDLVFYNRILRCYVLIDLKIGELTHQDLGQMQMYVNYYDRFVKTPEENKTVGIILCKRKNDSLVEITLPEHSRIFARKYQLYLPTKAQLKAQLDEEA